jgi:hypothetical protein
VPARPAIVTVAAATVATDARTICPDCPLGRHYRRPGPVDMGARRRRHRGGVLLAASNVLDGADRGLVLGFLAGTYVLWAAGLRVNLMANWRLLEDTGTSTNALSKVAFELARRRSSSQRAVRAASVAGYVVTEIAKEAPYYAGAFGAALLSDAVDSTDALVFLGGANVGAAVYEYGVARLTRTYLDGRSRRITRLRPPPAAAPYASFDTEWVPREYLTDYYRVVEPDERATIAFFVDALRHAEPDQPVLLFGVGPTLHHVFLTAGAAAEIHLADYLPANLREIERSVDEADLRRVLEPGFDWDDGVIEVCHLPAHRSQGYTSILLAWVRKSSTGCQPGAVQRSGCTSSAAMTASTASMWRATT